MALGIKAASGDAAGKVTCLGPKRYHATVEAELLPSMALERGPFTGWKSVPKHVGLLLNPTIL